VTPETKEKIRQWREKVLNGTITREELREALALMREDRTAFSTTARAAKRSGGTKKAKASDVDADALLDELDNL